MHTERKDPLIYSIRPDIEEAAFTSRKGIPYWILRNPDNHTYIRMNEDEYSLWNELKTGSSEKTLNSPYLNIHPDYSEKQVHTLIETLLERGFIHRKEEEIQGKIRGNERDSRITHYWELLIPLPGMGRTFDLLDKKVG